MKKCVLILDDDPEILLICKIILEQNNYIVATRLVCDDIIKDIKNVHPDIILMDLWIPFIGGEEAVHLIKNDSDSAQIPVILFSANTEIEKVAQRSNANGYLKKPFEIKTLLAVIKKTIK